MRPSRLVASCPLDCVVPFCELKSLKERNLISHSFLQRRAYSTREADGFISGSLLQEVDEHTMTRRDFQMSFSDHGGLQR